MDLYIALDGTYLIFFLRKEVNKEVGYSCKRGQEWINLLSMTPIGVYVPFWITDFLSRCSSWFWDKICENFLSLIDCLIAPKCEVQGMGDLDVETFLLTVLVVLERVEDELELILVVVTSLRTKDIEAKEEK